MDAVDQAFGNYRLGHPARPPDLSRQEYDDELRLITSSEGLRFLRSAPIDEVTVGMPCFGGTASDRNKYLWVVRSDRVCFALEYQSGMTLTRGRLAHTNLTGGHDAHSAGELWFVDNVTIIFNGGSSRYPPRSSRELKDIALAFAACGYRVACMGWSDETNTPARSLRGAPKWIS